MSSLPDTPTTDTPPALTLEQILRGQEGDIILSEPGKDLVNITAFTARQKVAGYVGNEISTMMGPDTPALVWSKQRLVWRVPIVLTTPRQGHVGYVGSIDVDARTGCLLIPHHLSAEVEANAAALVKRTPHPAAG